MVAGVVVTEDHHLVGTLHQGEATVVRCDVSVHEEHVVAVVGRCEGAGGGAEGVALVEDEAVEGHGGLVRGGHVGLV